MRRKNRLAAALSLAMLLAACGGGGALGDAVPGNDEDGEGTPFEGIGDAANSVQLLQAGPLTETADSGDVWVEVDGQRLEFTDTDSEVLDCIVNDEQLSIIYRGDGSEVRLSGLLLPDGWNLQLTVDSGDEQLLNGAALRSGTLGLDDASLSYGGPADVMEGGEIASQPDVTFAANCNT